eukprot:Skav228138  [mRNA]  locus=scaffold3237:99238:103435:+ [translate_table: standard]
MGALPKEISAFPRVTVLDVGCNVNDPFIDLVADLHSGFRLHQLTESYLKYNVVEACAGLGASSLGFVWNGFDHIASVEKQPKLAELHRLIHEAVEVIEADVTCPSTIRRVWECSDYPFVLVAGIACQPYSRGGHQGGGRDDRSSSLSGTLRTGFLSQCPAIVLECVPPAASNAFVRRNLEQLEHAGYTVSEICLKLEEVWGACRHRWWAVAVRSELGKVHLQQPPMNASLVVRDLMPFVKDWGQDANDQLALSEEEMQAFEEYGSAAQGRTRYRHLNAREVALLNGMQPEQNWSPDERLNLCAVGQLASPLQSVWVSGLLLEHLGKVLGDELVVDPIHQLGSYKKELWRQAHQMYSMGPALETPVAQKHVDKVRWNAEAQIAIHVQSDSKVSDVVSAELALVDDATGLMMIIDEGTGEELALDMQVDGKTLWIQTAIPGALNTVHPDPAPVEEDVEMVAAEATQCLAAHFAVEDEPSPPAEDSQPTASLHNLGINQLLGLLPPVVSDTQLCAVMRLQQMKSVDRLQVLRNQGTTWGDDEVWWHMQQIAHTCGDMSLIMVDPLIMSSWLSSPGSITLGDMLASDTTHLRMFSAVNVGGHWTPCLWTLHGSTLHVSTWESDGVDVSFLHPLHTAIAKVVHATSFQVSCLRRSYCSLQCGAAVIAFLAFHVNDAPLPCQAADLDLCHIRYREAFRAMLNQTRDTSRPWCWGAGPDITNMLMAILQLHGVPGEVSQSRAQVILQSLGRESVHKAITGGSPWKSLKALANQHSPVIQLVMPDELQAVVQNKPKGAKTKKAPKDKVTPVTRPAVLDPSRLTIPAGTFRVNDNVALPQLTIGQVSPLASGVALVSHSEALPLLRGNNKLTSAGLALLIVNAPQDLQTSLEHQQVRVAVKCTLNNEPMLITGTLVQLGSSKVFKFNETVGPEIAPVEVACLGITVFKDQWEGNWEEFATQPVKQLLKLLPSLGTCRESDCTCAAWHPPNDATVQDCIVDVFRRQFFSDAGRAVSWEKSTHFSVMIRCVKSQESKTLACSGSHGIYMEPKNTATTAASDEFQVVWLPDDYATVAHKARMEPHSCGIARHATRYGIRVPAAYFRQVFQSLKPEGLFLAPGPRLSWVCGPWPYGTDRKSLMKLFQSKSWDARPLQPVQSLPEGQMWSVHSLDEPDSTVWSLKHGQVVFTKDEKPQTNEQPSQSIVGQQRTVQLCKVANDPSVDPLQVNDPWKQAVPRPSAAASAQHPDLQAIESRIEKSILAKLPAETMEVDDTPDRLAQLEQQMHQLATRQGAIENTVQENHAQQTAQVRSLQSQMAAQMDRQGRQLQSMFDSQMEKMEAILNKKARTDVGPHE